MQVQLHTTHSPLANHFDKMCDPAGVFVGHYAIVQEVGLTHQLVEKTFGRDFREMAGEPDEDFGGADTRLEDDDVEYSNNHA